MSLLRKRESRILSKAFPDFRFGGNDDPFFIASQSSLGERDGVKGLKLGKVIWPGMANILLGSF